MRAAIADEQPHTGFLHDAAIFVLEIRRCFDDLRRDLDNIEALNLARREDRIGRHAAPEANHERVARLRMQQGGKKPKQALSEHVSAVRCVDFAIDR